VGASSGVRTVVASETVDLGRARYATALGLGAIVILSAAARFAVARSFDVPWIAPDEMIYGLAGESLWETGSLTVRGASIPYYSLLTPALVGLPLGLDDLRAGVAIAQALQALAMSLVAVPVYIWGKRLVGTRWAITAAGLSVLPPALWYGGLLMTEALSYTLVTASLLVLARTLEKPTLMRQGTFLLLVTVAATVRLQALLLLPALLLAAGLYAWFGRSWTTIRRLAPMLAVGLCAVVTIAVYGTDRSDLLGAYSGLADSGAPSTGALTQIVWHSGALVLMTLGLPLFATATLVVSAAATGERDRPTRAFLAATGAYVVLLVVQVSAFAVGNLDHVSERYLVTALPALLLGLCIWIARGAVRPPLVVVSIAAASVVLLAALPAGRIGTEEGAHDALTILPFVELAEPGEITFRAALAGFGLVAAFVFLFLPRRMLAAAVGGLALALVGVSALAAREIDQFSRLANADAFGSSDQRWVDAAGSGGPVLVIDTGEVSWPSIARITFWNRSIRRLVRLSGVESRGPLPETSVDIHADGTLADASGNAISEPRVLVPTTHVVAGEQLATSPATASGPGYGLWRAEEPLRLVSRAEGFTPVGDFAGIARVVVYRCNNGALELTLLGKQGLPIKVRVNGVPLRTIRVAPGRVWRGSIPAFFSADGTGACVFELESDGLVGSTRVDWVAAPS
jgi:hypothetical protein